MPVIKQAQSKRIPNIIKNDDDHLEFVQIAVIVCSGCATFEN